MHAGVGLQNGKETTAAAPPVEVDTSAYMNLQLVASIRAHAMTDKHSAAKGQSEEWWKMGPMTRSDVSFWSRCCVFDLTGHGVF